MCFLAIIGKRTILLDTEGFEKQLRTNVDGRLI